MLRQLLILLIALLWFPWSASAMTTDLTWTPNTEEDVAGYRVYGGQPCGDPKALPFIADVGNVTSYRYVGPDASTEFEITAYDTSGNESTRSNRACKFFVLTYVKSVTDSTGVVWGLVGTGPKYRVYRNGADLCPTCEQNHASDVRLNNGVPEFLGTDGDTRWYVFSFEHGWKLADSTPPAAPTGLEAK